MQLISRVCVSRFRSIKELELDDLGDFTVLAGLNNSGKSNILRAVHAFFTNESEPGHPLDFARDFYRPDAGKKHRKRIKVSIALSSFWASYRSGTFRTGYCQLM